MTGLSDPQDHRIAAGHLNDLLANLQIGPLSVELHLVGVGWVDPLEEQVLDVGAGVGDTPGDPLVVTDHDTGKTGEGEAGHVQGAGIAYGFTMQGILIPDRRHADAQVGVVGQDRFPRGSAGA